MTQRHSHLPGLGARAHALALTPAVARGAVSTARVRVRLVQAWLDPHQIQPGDGAVRTSGAGTEVVGPHTARRH